MNATRAVADLIRESLKYRRFFKQCCETSVFRLRSQAWQFGDELLDRGQPFSREDLENALLTIARKVLPETPAAAWDAEWAGALFKDALARMEEHYAELTAKEAEVLELSGQGPWTNAMYTAGEENDPAAYRAVVKSWERAGLEALRTARRGVA